MARHSLSLHSHRASIARVRTPIEIATGFQRAVGFILACLVGLGGVRLANAGAARHPQDGPHADVRIRVENERVVLNIQMNLLFIDYVAPVPRENPEDVDPVEEPMIRDAAIRFLRTKNRVVIDGIEVQPVVREYEFHRPGLEYLPLFPKSGMRGLLKIHAVLDYPAQSPPEVVRMTWGGYPPDWLSGEMDAAGRRPSLVLSALLTAEGTDKLIDFSVQEPEYVWTRTGETFADRMLHVPPVPGASDPIPLPVVTLVILVIMVVMLTGLRFGGNWSHHRRTFYMAIPLFLIAGGLTLHIGTIQVSNPFKPAVPLPTEDQAVAIFRPLHANIYSAFDYTNESDIYDALAQSVEGDLLDTLYNQIYQGLVAQDQGAAVSRVQAVTPIETDVESIRVNEATSEPEFTIRTRWQVEGAVYHFGHSHTRLNEYEARYVVLGTGDGWRISDSTIIQQYRVDSEPGPPVDVPLELQPGQDI